MEAEIGVIDSVTASGKRHVDSLESLSVHYGQFTDGTVQDFSKHPSIVLFDHAAEGIVRQIHGVNAERIVVGVPSVGVSAIREQIAICILEVLVARGR